jgi:hypothetical protein
MRLNPEQLAVWYYQGDQQALESLRELLSARSKRTMTGRCIEVLARQKVRRPE